MGYQEGGDAIGTRLLGSGQHNNDPTIFAGGDKPFRAVEDVKISLPDRAAF